MKCYRSGLEWRDLILLGLVLLLLAIAMSGCIYIVSHDEMVYDATPRPETYEYKIVPYQNNLLLPPQEFTQDVMKRIEGTGYLFWRGSRAKRIHGTYLWTIWVYYDRDN